MTWTPYQKHRNRPGLKNWLDSFAKWYTPNINLCKLTWLHVFEACCSFGSFSLTCDLPWLAYIMSHRCQVHLMRRPANLGKVVYVCCFYCACIRKFLLSFLENMHFTINKSWVCNSSRLIMFFYEKHVLITRKHKSRSVKSSHIYQTIDLNWDKKLKVQQ